MCNQTNIQKCESISLFGFYIRVCIRNLYAIHQDTKSTWYSWWHKNVWIFISTNIMLTNTNNNQLWPHNKRRWFNTTTTQLTITLSHMRTTHWRAAGRIAQGYPQRTPHFVVILIWTNPHTITYRYFYKSCCCLLAAGINGERFVSQATNSLELSWINRVWCRVQPYQCGLCGLCFSYFFILNSSILGVTK